MTQKITVSIPFYNSSKYIEDAIRLPLFDSRVDEIIISDDYSSDEEYSSLLNIIQELLNGRELSFDPNYNLISERNHHSKPSIMFMTGNNVSEEAKKIKIIRNKSNLGGFSNKYVSVKESKNEWVYLLDSDNFLIETSISALYTIDEWDEKVCYCPSVPIMERKDNWRQWDDWNHRRFGYQPIDLKRIKELFEIDNVYQKKYNCGLGTNGFLNTGNFFVNKNQYINTVESAIQKNIEPHAADVIAFSYYWLISGNYFQIIPELYYYHRIRNDSFWQKTGRESGSLSQMYEEMIKNANA
jgi:glycosyltransferase involved in cell wall biosynthesis